MISQRVSLCFCALAAVAVFALAGCRNGGSSEQQSIDMPEPSASFASDDNAASDDDAKQFLMDFLKRYIDSGRSVATAKQACTDDFFQFYELALKGKTLNDDGELEDDEPHDLIFPTAAPADRVTAIDSIASAGELSFLVTAKAKTEQGENYAAHFVVTVIDNGNGSFLLDDSQNAD